RFNLQKYLGHSLGIMKGPGDGDKTHEVIIELDAFGTDLIRGRRWHPTQQLTDLPNSTGSRLTMTLSSLEEIERQVLSWGVHATVVEPACLRHRLACITSELSATYADALEADSPALHSLGDGGSSLAASKRRE